MAKPTSKRLAKVIQLYSGADLIGSKTSVHSKDALLELEPWGFLMTSKKTKRTLGLPWANIKIFELIPETTIDDAQ